MLIECKIHREGGTRVDVNGVEWHFKADAFGRHICDVTDSKVADILLGIPEGYQRAKARVQGAALAQPQPRVAPVVPLGSNVPVGAPQNLDQMSRGELFAYGKSLGMPTLPGFLSDEKLRLNIALFLRERADLDADVPEADQVDEQGETEDGQDADNADDADPASDEEVADLT